MKKLIQNFVYCGILGWCLEITFTAFHAFRRRELHLSGNTSIWMFPIYGMASLIAPIYRKIKGKHILIRGAIYAVLIFAGEYLTGTWLMKKELCPWNYEHCKWNINKVVRLDYLPLWIIVGLLFERLIRQDEA